MNPVVVPGQPVPMPAPAPPLPVAVPPIPAPPNFNGQWTGLLLGETPGYCVLELEMTGGMITGKASLLPADESIVPATIDLSFAPFLGNHQFQNIPVRAFDPDAGQAIDRARMAVRYPLSDVSPTVNVSISFQGPNVVVSFNSALTFGHGILTKAHTTPSGVQPLSMSWEGFRDWMLKWPGRETFVFRGQSENWPLRTSFHRSSMKNLERYENVLIPETYKAVVNKLTGNFDLSKKDDLWSFYSVLQHHGYPTPLLDWSESVWVAAYFAFENAKMRADKSVRIFAFDRIGWHKTLQQKQLTMTRPHISFMDIIPRGNNRAGPQKSMFTVTNVDDIEAHIRATEANVQQQFLWVIDIPTVDRDKALADLDDFNVNRSMLFPDLDGFCRSMRIKQFGAD